MRIFLLDPKEYAPHVFLLLLPIVVTILAHFQHLLFTLIPCVSMCLAYLLTYTLYIAVVTNAAVLYELEKLPFYESDTISQELVHLLHDTLRLQSYYSASTPDPDQTLLHVTGDLVRRTLNTLHLHGFHTYITRLHAETLFPILLPLYQSMSPLNRERYREIVTSEPADPVIKVTLSPIPVPPPSSSATVSSPTSLTSSLAFRLSSHPSSPSISLASRISSRPPSPTTTLVPETGFSQENALLRATYTQRTVTGHQIISAPTQTLPGIFLKPPATPDTQCFRCHNKGHYQENCPSYHCPHCHEMAPGHPSHLCLRTRCSFCKRWGHSNRACPHRICGDCDQPGHIADDCPFSNLTPEQAAHVFRDGTPL